MGNNRFEPLLVVSSYFSSPEQARNPGQPDARWFAEEVCPHEPALRAWLRARFPSLSDIDDLVQETYARLFRARSAGRVGEVRPYLFVIARNAAVDLVRRNRIVPGATQAEIDAMAVAEERPSAAEATCAAQQIELLHEAIEALPERCRAVLRLRKLHGLSYREIAQRLGISENTVDAHIRTGIFRCRQYLRNRGVSRTDGATEPRG